MSVNKFDFEQLKRDIRDLKFLLTDQLSSQININCQMRAELDVMKSRVTKFHSTKRILRYLIEKYKCQKVKLDLIVELLHGKLDADDGGSGRCCCQCSSNVTVVSDSTQQQKEKQTVENEIRIQSDRKSDPIVTESATNTGRFHYNTEQIGRIGRTEYNCYQEDVGQLECLNEMGQWTFNLSKICKNKEWIDNILSREDWILLGSRLLLPTEMSGITVCVNLDGLKGIENRNKLKIGFMATSYQVENHRVNLPVEFSVEVALKHKNGLFQNTKRHQFVISNLTTTSEEYLAEPDNFIIELENLDKYNLPEMIFTFFV